MSVAVRPVMLKLCCCLGWALCPAADDSKKPGPKALFLPCHCPFDCCPAPWLPAAPVAAGFPFCFKTCGLGLAILLVLVTLAAAELSMRLLLMSSQLTGKRSYEELARHSYGRLGQWAVDSCVIAMNVGSVVAYLNILTDTISSVAGGRCCRWQRGVMCHTDHARLRLQSNGW